MIGLPAMFRPRPLGGGNGGLIDRLVNGYDGSGSAGLLGPQLFAEAGVQADNWLRSPLGFGPREDDGYRRSTLPAYSGSAPRFSPKPQSGAPRPRAGIPSGPQAPAVPAPGDIDGRIMNARTGEGGTKAQADAYQQSIDRGVFDGGASAGTVYRPYLEPRAGLPRNPAPGFYIGLDGVTRRINQDGSVQALPDGVRRDQGFGFGLGVTRVLDNAATGLEWGANKLTFGGVDQLTNGLNELTGWEAPTAREMRRRNQAYAAEQARNGRLPGRVGQFGGELAAAAPVALLPGGLTAQGAMAGAMVTHSDTLPGVATDAALGAGLGKAGDLALRGLLGAVMPGTMSMGRPARGLAPRQAPAYPPRRGPTELAVEWDSQAPEPVDAVMADLAARGSRAQASGNGVGGPRLLGLENDYASAVEALARMNGGDAIGVLRLPDSGEPADLIYGRRPNPNGKGGYGLAKLLDIHREAIENLPARLAGMRFLNQEGNRRTYVRGPNDEERAVFGLDWHGQPKN